LRNFFNDLGDTFEPTHRHNRVQPDWLYATSKQHMGFFFYDLTSFTSWFHEQVPFLRAVADRLRGVPVHLVGEGISLTEHDLGALIDAYTDNTTDFAQFVVSAKLSPGMADQVLRHQCAGFLGVPGNLITCTLAHGLALASGYQDPSELQVPGDDVGAAARNEDHLQDGMLCAATLGVLQFDKVFRFPEISIYLKRLVVDLGRSITLAPMLIYPLLPYLVNPVGNLRSNRFTLPDSDRLEPRAASVLVAFHRDIWKMTNGKIDTDSREILLTIVRKIHSQVGLPFGAIFQGRLYDDEDSDRRFSHIAVKFPVDEDECFDRNPDLHFASRFVTRMTIRSVVDVRISSFRSLEIGETIVVKNSKGWRFLEDMGYVEIGSIPGEKIDLIGSDARDAFLFASRPNFREVRVTSVLEEHQLVAAGVIPSVETVSFEDKRVFSSTGFDLNLQSYRYRRYVDLDDPRSAGFYGRSKDWVNDVLTDTRFFLYPLSLIS